MRPGVGPCSLRTSRARSSRFTPRPVKRSPRPARTRTTKRGVPRETPSGVEAAFRALAWSDPVVVEVMEAIRAEEVTAEAGRGGVAAVFGVDGRLRALEVRSRHAIETPPEDLAGQIRTVLAEAAAAAERRRLELVGALGDADAVQRRFDRGLERLRERVEALRDRLPGGKD